jgi:hypothetical protein|tara:strand:+ start:1907 stop:2638 length:732 start_codon:yes stop_codon:yes gene_type:complete
MIKELNKKNFFVFFIIIFYVLTVFNVGGVIAVEEDNFLTKIKNLFVKDNKDTNDKGGAWSWVKEKTKPLTSKVSGFFSTTFGFVGDKVMWIIGVKSFEGEGVVWFYGYFLSLEFWDNVLFAGIVSIWIFLFWFFLTLNFYRNSLEGYDFINKKFSVFLKRFLPLFISYIILGGIPFFNRVLQIITLEILGLHIIWRSLIIGSVLYFGPIYAKRYFKYKRRNRLYKQKLEKVAGEEISKAMSNA